MKASCIFLIDFCRINSGILYNKTFPSVVPTKRLLLLANLWIVQISYPVLVVFKLFLQLKSQSFKVQSKDPLTNYLSLITTMDLYI
jgi:hypothetical protein